MKAAAFLPILIAAALHPGQSFATDSDDGFEADRCRWVLSQIHNLQKRNTGSPILPYPEQAGALTGRIDQMAAYVDQEAKALLGIPSIGARATAVRWQDLPPQFNWRAYFDQVKKRVATQPRSMKQAVAQAHDDRSRIAFPYLHEGLLGLRLIELRQDIESTKPTSHLDFFYRGHHAPVVFLNAEMPEQGHIAVADHLATANPGHDPVLTLVDSPYPVLSQRLKDASTLIRRGDQIDYHPGAEADHLHFNTGHIWLSGTYLLKEDRFVSARALGDAIRSAIVHYHHSTVRVEVSLRHFYTMSADQWVDIDSKLTYDSIIRAKQKGFFPAVHGHPNREDYEAFQKEVQAQLHQMALGLTAHVPELTSEFKVIKPTESSSMDFIFEFRLFSGDTVRVEFKGEYSLDKLTLPTGPPPRRPSKGKE